VYEVPQEIATSVVKTSVTKTSTKDADNPKTWSDRRRMAYVSLIGIFAVTFVVLGPWVALDRLAVLTDLLAWYYFALASIVGAYCGFKAWASRT
jgi:hypothetical protein